MLTSGQMIGLSHAQAIDTEMCVIKRQSMDRRCDVLMRAHEHTGCSNVGLSYDTLRKRLGEAVREYGYLMAAHADLHSLGADKYPQGLLTDCGGCWEAAQPADLVRSKHTCMSRSALPAHSNPKHARPCELS